MKRTLVIAIRELTAPQRQDIARAAAAHGFEALFFDSVEEALPALANAEVAFGQSPAPGAKRAQTALAVHALCRRGQLPRPGALCRPGRGAEAIPAAPMALPSPSTSSW